VLSERCEPVSVTPAPLVAHATKRSRHPRERRRGSVCTYWGLESGAPLESSCGARDGLKRTSTTFACAQSATSPARQADDLRARLDVAKRGAISHAVRLLSSFALHQAKYVPLRHPSDHDDFGLRARDMASIRSSRDTGFISMMSSTLKPFP
jgi:hypothetical protein